MAASNKDSDEIISEINIVPLVDIILVVLIIFMVTAPAMMQPSLKLNLPEAASAELTEPSFLQVVVGAEGQVLINNQEVDEESVKKIASIEVEKNPLVQAVISADETTHYGTVIRVMDWLKSVGVDDFAVSTEKGS